MQALNSHFLSVLQDRMEYRAIRKHAFLLKAGQVCRELFFIRSGLVLSYYREKDTEISACFMKENDWLLSIESFYEQTPAREYFQALEDTQVYAITRPQLQHALQDHPALQHFERLLTQHYYQDWNQQLLATRLQSARYRQDWLLHQHPDLLKRVPAKYLASWLGMAEVTFSKIRTARARAG